MLDVLERLIPGIEEMTLARDLRLPTDIAEPVGVSPSELAACETKIENFYRMMQYADAGRINGLFFCGEAIGIGRGISLASARVAALKAVHYYRHSGGDS